MPRPFHQQPITCVVSAEPGNLLSNHGVPPAYVNIFLFPHRPSHHGRDGDMELTLNRAIFNVILCVQSRLIRAAWLQPDREGGDAAPPTSSVDRFLWGTENSKQNSAVKSMFLNFDLCLDGGLVSLCFLCVCLSGFTRHSREKRRAE